MNYMYMDYNYQDCNILKDGHLKKIAAAYTGWGAGNVPEPFGVAFQHVRPTFINAYIVSWLPSFHHLVECFI